MIRFSGRPAALQARTPPATTDASSPTSSSIANTTSRTSSSHTTHTRLGRPPGPPRPSPISCRPSPSSGSRNRAGRPITATGHDPGMCPAVNRSVSRRSRTTTSRRSNPSASSSTEMWPHWRTPTPFRPTSRPSYPERDGAADGRPSGRVRTFAAAWDSSAAGLCHRLRWLRVRKQAVSNRARPLKNDDDRLARASPQPEMRTTGLLKACPGGLLCPGCGGVGPRGPSNLTTQLPGHITSYVFPWMVRAETHAMAPPSAHAAAAGHGLTPPGGTQPAARLPRRCWRAAIGRRSPGPTSPRPRSAHSEGSPQGRRRADPPPIEPRPRRPRPRDQATASRAPHRRRC